MQECLFLPLFRARQQSRDRPEARSAPQVLSALYLRNHVIIMWMYVFMYVCMYVCIICAYFGACVG
jgi:hypothetical protein